MKKFTFVGFLMFFMLFNVTVGKIFGQSLDLPSGGQLKIMGAKEVFSNKMFVDIPKDKKCIAIDIFIDNTNGKSDVKFGLWDNKLIFRDLDGYIYEQDITKVSLVDKYFDQFITLLKGDIYRSWYVILIPTNVSINDLSVRFEDTIKNIYSKWERIKI